MGSRTNNTPHRRGPRRDLEGPRRGEAERVLRITNHFLEIANRHTYMKPMLDEFVRELGALTGAEAVGIRLLDEEGNIPYQAYRGFSRKFYETESPLSIKIDKCMCIYVIRGETDPSKPFFTRYGSFYMNGTTKFLAGVSEEDKGETRNVCNLYGYESVALIPILVQGRIIGLIHIADHREDIVPLDRVKLMERLAVEVGANIQRVRAEQELRLTRYSVDRAADEMYWLSPDGQIRYVNDTACRHLGYSRRELLNMTFCDIHPGLPHDGCEEIWKELEKRGTIIFESYEKANDGRLIPVEITSNLVSFEGRDYNCAFVKDITDRKRVELEIEKHRLHLEHIVKERTARLEQSMDQLKLTQAQLIQTEKMASLGVLTAGIAHELNNPINFISSGIAALKNAVRDLFQVMERYEDITARNVKGQLEYIASFKESIQFDETCSGIAELLENVETGSVRAAEIVKGLRSFSRLDQDERKLSDIHELIDLPLMILRPKYKKKIQIVRQFGNVPKFECFPGKLTQVFMNILENAVSAILGKKKLRKKEEIRIETRVQQEEGRELAVVSVSDTGPGIPISIQGKIFDPFFTTKEVGKGTGLGLSICLTIVESHGGYLQLESKEGRGATFIIKLPLE